MLQLGNAAEPDCEGTGAGATGLTADEAARRLAIDGPNELHRAGPKPRWRILFQQMRGAMVWLLLIACVISALLGEVTDALAIGAILVLNAVIGSFQESRAERAVRGDLLVLVSVAEIAKLVARAMGRSRGAVAPPAAAEGRA